MRRLLRASLSSSITSPRDLARQSPSTSSSPAGQSTPNDVNAWVAQTSQTSSTSTIHWLVLIPYRFHDHGFNFFPIIRECKEDETRITIKRFIKQSASINDDAQASEICFASRVVSRSHAEIWCEAGGEFYIRDVSSSSGTFLNRERLSEAGQDSSAFPLKDGDIVQLGIEYEDGVEMADRAVKIRVVIGHGKNKAAQLRSSMLPAIDSAGNGNLDPSNDLTGQPIVTTLDSAVPVHPAKPLLEVVVDALVDTNSDTEQRNNDESKTRPGLEIDEAHTPTVVQHNPRGMSLDEVAPPRYHTPSPTPVPQEDDLPFLSIQSQTYDQQALPAQDTEQVLHEDDLSRYTSQNRHIISPELELKLRKAHYLPEDDPDEVPAQEWQSRYGVGYFELKRLRQLYAKRIQ